MMLQKNIGVITAGRPTPGMNAAVRAVVRTGLFLRCRVFYIFDGFEGLIENRFKEATYDSCVNLICKGGTVLGSKPSTAFMTREGKAKAVCNLINSSINNLIVIGGAGSMKALCVLKNEWRSLVDEIVSKGAISEAMARKVPYLGVCGLPSTVTNDFWGTDVTLGTDTALTRIIDCVNLVEEELNSTQRVFVVEVFGSQCGYLAMTAGLAVEADFVFVPEWPPVAEWRDILPDKLRRMAMLGRRLNLIVVAEGSKDADGKPITPAVIKQLVHEKLGYHCSISSLGHLQCGGSPTGFDRVLGARMGAEALIACVQRDEEKDGIFVALRSNQIERGHLERAVMKTTAAEEAFLQQDFARCVALRGAHFNQKGIFLDTVSMPPRDCLTIPDFTFAVVHIGAPAAGMNAATYALVRFARFHNCQILGINGGWPGFVAGDVRPLDWSDVTGWISQGGSALGTSSELACKPDEVSAVIANHNIRGVAIIGGFEALHSALIIREWASDYNSFLIPVEVVPATVCNNLPGVPESLGSDTALNEICRTIDNIKQSARGTKKKVFVVEVQGGCSGYLATMGAIATGADNAHIFEEELKPEDVVDDVEEASQKIARGVSHYVLIRADGASETISSRNIQKAFAKAGEGKFAAKLNVLGHSVQGGKPTAFDRNAATRYGARAFERLLSQTRAASHDAEMIGVRFGDAPYADIGMLETLTCFVHRNVRKPWWLSTHGLMRVLASYTQRYEKKIPPEHSENARLFDGRFSAASGR